MSPVAVPCSNSFSVPKCNDDLTICLLLFFFQINMLLMLLLYNNFFFSSMFYLSLKHISISSFPWLPECTGFIFLDKTIVMTTWSDLTTSGRQNYTVLPMRALNAFVWLCSRVHIEPLVVWYSVRFLWLI